MKCPLCGGTECQNKFESYSNALKYYCKEYDREFLLSGNIEQTNNTIKQNQLNNLLFEFVIRNAVCGDENKNWWFQYLLDYRLQDKDASNIVNLAEINYPDTLAEKTDRILLNLYNIKAGYGEWFHLGGSFARAFFTDTDDNTELVGVYTMLQELGYITVKSKWYFMISAKGWQRLDELIRKNRDRKQAFIAMAFKSETQGIREAFRKGISNAGFKPIAIDEKEHNNQIVPEIFYEIDNSSFLVMDVTYPNYGAYYEAGYALGKGKQVIICCRKDSFEGNERPHFDIAQKSMIVWKDEEELVERLEKRIRATVG